ncbi:MAG: DUF167 domain-containing protein [Candidatus Liptonbacteria bacterium]|nr:DUF167 domain-containing protein [Candidatus Liptonbacteria bacterium]
MEIKIRVINNAKKERIIKEGNIYKVYVSVPPEKGRANQRIIELVADFFKVRKNQVKIKKGLKSKEKIIAVDI